jgi:hypothetical protein
MVRASVVRSINRGGAKQLYGVRPSSVPTRQLRCLRGNAPQKPLRARRRPGKAASSIPTGWRSVDRERSHGLETVTELVIGRRRASAQLGASSSSGQPRQNSFVQRPRATVRRPIQSDEVEPVTQVCHPGSRPRFRLTQYAFAPRASVRPVSSPRRAEVVQLLSIACSRNCRALLATQLQALPFLLFLGNLELRSPQLFRFTGKRTAWDRMAAACAIDEKPCGRSSPPEPPGPSSCRVYVPAWPATSSPPAWPATSSRLPR